MIISFHFIYFYYFHYRSVTPASPGSLGTTSGGPGGPAVHPPRGPGKERARVIYFYLHHFKYYGTFVLARGK